MIDEKKKDISKIRLKYTTYIAGPIEDAIDGGAKDSRTEIWAEFEPEREQAILGIYDPIRQEASKVGKPSGEHCKYIKGLKRSGNFSKFHESMWSIWWGAISPNADLLDVLRHLRRHKHIHGNKLYEFNYFGDFEAVTRSDFVIVYLPTKKIVNGKEVPIITVGTHWEIIISAMLKIPVYLILPDTTKTEANSTLLFGIGPLMSNGEVFYSIKECTNYIREKYNMKKQVTKEAK